jgi:hypothetical protein
MTTLQSPTLTTDEIKARFRITRRRGRIFTFVVCPLALAASVLVPRFAGIALGITVSGYVALVSWLVTCAALAYAGFSIGRCPACNVFVGSPPLHRWGQPRVCRGCGAALT